MSILPTTAVPVWLFSQNADGTLSPAKLSSGGSGTVNSGTANQIAYYAATGTAVSGDALLTDSGTVLGYTGTGGITSSGQFLGPNGSSTVPTFSFSNLPERGMCIAPTSTGIGFTLGDSSGFSMVVNGGATGIQVGTLGGYIWANGSNPDSNTRDTGLGRASAGVVSVDTSSIGNGLGTITATGYQAGGTAGVSAGPFTAITAITAKAGIVTQLTGSSDERLKTAKSYEGGLTEILAINPVSYHWNEKGQEHTGLSGEQEYVGFLAQDVQKAIPQAITAIEKSKDGSEEYLSFDDRPIVAALVNCIKQLEARIKVLEAK